MFKFMGLVVLLALVGSSSVEAGDFLMSLGFGSTSSILNQLGFGNGPKHPPVLPPARATGEFAQIDEWIEGCIDINANLDEYRDKLTEYYKNNRNSMSGAELDAWKLVVGVSRIEPDGHHCNEQSSDMIGRLIKELNINMKAVNDDLTGLLRFTFDKREEYGQVCAQAHAAQFRYVKERVLKPEVKKPVEAIMRTYSEDSNHLLMRLNPFTEEGDERLMRFSKPPYSKIAKAINSGIDAHGGKKMTEVENPKTKRMEPAEAEVLAHIEQLKQECDAYAKAVSRPLERISKDWVTFANYRGLGWDGEVGLSWGTMMICDQLKNEIETPELVAAIQYSRSRRQPPPKRG